MPGKSPVTDTWRQRQSIRVHSPVVKHLSSVSSHSTDIKTQTGTLCKELGAVTEMLGQARFRVHRHLPTCFCELLDEFKRLKETFSCLLSSFSFTVHPHCLVSSSICFFSEAGFVRVALAVRVDEDSLPPSLTSLYLRYT